MVAETGSECENSKRLGAALDKRPVEQIRSAGAWEASEYQATHQHDS